MSGPIRGGAVAQSVIAFLRGHPPFDHMEEAALAALAANARVAYFAQDEIVVSPASGIAATYYVIHKGRVKVGQSDSNAYAGAPDLMLGPGESFPISALLGHRATTSTYRAAGDLFCYALAGERFHELMRASPVLQAFCTGHLATLLAHSQNLLRNRAGHSSLEQHGMASPLADLLRHAPVSCAADTTVRTVLERMRDDRVGSMVIVDDAGRATGIFTERDALTRVAAAGLDTALTIAQVMTPAPLALPMSATAGEAALLMARHGMRHVVVLQADRFCGVVSERDLFALQRTSLPRMSENIAAANSVEEVARAAADIRLLARNLLTQGIGAEQLTQFIAELNDRVTRRVIELVLARHELGETAFCWIALGSEGRLEQTFSTDQDNGIIFDAPEGESAALRARLLPFATEVNAALARCGFPLCQGNIMAGNPAFCLSLAEWQAEFSGWIRNSTPEALLNAAIFFDFRPVWGVAALAERLRDWLLGTAGANSRFLHQMAANALQMHPPLGLLHDFATSGAGRDAETLDLKAHGARLFVDVARIYALQSGVAATGTAARIRASGAALGVKPEESAALLDAFFFIQMLRLRHDISAGGAEATSANRIRPDGLNALERRILKEALLSARRMQKRLALDYQL
jgi:CBS domain-containing protein